MSKPSKHRAGHPAKAPRRDPSRTRQRLLQAAFQEIYKSGFRGTDLDAILKVAGVTKGAMYHHFKNKEALGYAVLDEVIHDGTREKWLWPLKNAVNPIDTLVAIVKGTSLRPHHLACGCPLNNLSQEMAPLDEGFRKRIVMEQHAYGKGEYKYFRYPLPDWVEALRAEL